MQVLHLIQRCQRRVGNGGEQMHGLPRSRMETS